MNSSKPPGSGSNPAEDSEAIDYHLVELPTGVRTIRSARIGETFHPVIGPEAEAVALYSGQMNLTAPLRSGVTETTIWDIGLGGAANPIVVIKSLVGTGRSIRIVSFDHTLEPLEFAITRSRELRYLEGWEEWLLRLVKTGESRFAFHDLQIEWMVHKADFPALANSENSLSWPKPDAILFDAFSPARNPAMWTLPLFARLHSLLDSSRPCLMPTYSRSTLLRTTLLLAGFFVGRGRATGEKEETTIAANDQRLIESPLDAAWLRRCRNSTSAEPMLEPVYKQQKLSEHNWSLLQEHPQFRLVEGSIPAKL